MKTLRKLLWRDTVVSVLFVAVAFLALFYFIDVVEDLDQVGKRGRQLWHVLLAAVFELPSHFYELFPIAVLIGTIYALARLAQSSEFTILRTSGLGPGRALGMLAVLGAAFGLVTFAVGEVAAPASERALARLQGQFSGGLRVGGAGAWLKEKRDTAQGEHALSIQIGSTSGAGVLFDVLIFEFDARGHLVQRVSARQARVQSDQEWLLEDAEVTQWPAPGRSGEPVRVQNVARMPWAATWWPQPSCRCRP
jgi:lipopolysaccharide export system permease protein